MARWNHEFNRKLFGNLTFYYSRYNFNIASDEKSQSATNTDRFYLRYFSGIRDWTLKYDIDFMPSPNHFIKAGVSGIDHYYKPGAMQSKVAMSGFNEDTLIKYRFITCERS